MNLLVQTGRLQILAERLRPLCERLASHSLYRSFKTVEDLHVFMEVHVFAVWDFMSLLKTLQRGLTCMEIPWVPSKFAASRRLINEIVLGEASDIYQAETLSHFELYLRAMRKCGASTIAIETLIEGLGNGSSWEEALIKSGAPDAAQSFVRNTFAIVEGNRLHATAAAFTFGREDLIPDMFRGFIRDQNERLYGKLELMRWYMERHIEVDGEEHGPMALQMVSELCGDDAVKWDEASEAAEIALQARLVLWDGIERILKEKRMMQALP